MSTELIIGTATVRALEAILPAAWRLEWHSSHGQRGLDGSLILTPPEGPGIIFDVEIKGRFEPRDVGQLADQFARHNARNPLLFAPYISDRSRELLRERGISYADPSGNIAIAASSVLISQTGAQKDPAKSTHPRTSLRGPITGRIVRYLCEHDTPFAVRDISRDTDVRTGNISRMLEYLEREHLITRGDRGAVENVYWKQLVEKWAVALEMDRVDATFLEPHGIDATLRKLQNASEPYALTGQFASARLAPLAPSISLDIYATDIFAFAQMLGLRETTASGNVRIINAYDRVALENTLTYDGLALAAPPQIAADLLTLPHRSRAEYDSLLNWMDDNADVWRR